jgi:hypothetical protein
LESVEDWNWMQKGKMTMEAAVPTCRTMMMTTTTITM